MTKIFKKINTNHIVYLFGLLVFFILIILFLGFLQNWKEIHYSDVNTSQIIYEKNKILEFLC